MRFFLVISAMLFLIAPVSAYAEPNGGKPFLIVNKANNKLAYVKGGKVEEIIDVATGKTNDLTPEGLFTVVVKAKNPYYRKKDIPGGDPRNPLGSRWIGFDAQGTDGRTYGVHGTNAPWSIGRYISNGCIRMENKNVERLYEKVPIGTKILVTMSAKSFKAIAKEQGYIQ